MNKGLILVIGCLLTVSLGSVTGNILLYFDLGATLISGIVSIIGFLGYLATDSIYLRLLTDKSVKDNRSQSR